MDLGGQHIFLITLGVYFLYKTIGIWLAESIESFHAERRLKKERARRERDRKNAEKILQKRQELQNQIDSVRAQMTKGAESGSVKKGGSFATMEQMESLLAELKSELGEIKRKRALINVSRVILLLLLIIAILAPLLLDTVGNLYTIPGYEFLGVGSQDGVGEWIFGRLIIGSIIIGIGYTVSRAEDDESEKGLSATIFFLGAIILLFAVWIFFCLWVHQLWNGSEQWWWVFLGIIITGLISYWDRLQSESPP